MLLTNLFASYFLVHALMLSISTASNVTENEIKGTYYERRKASEDSILNSIVSTHKNLRYH